MVLVSLFLWGLTSKHNYAQNIPVTNKSEIWGHYFYNLYFPKKLYIAGDVSIRWSMDLKSFSFYLVRAGLAFRPTKFFKFLVGYANTGQDFISQKPTVEHRLYQDFMFDHAKNEWRFGYRIRFEEQFFNLYKNGDYVPGFQFRFRTMFQFVYYLKRTDKYNLQLKFSNEFLFAESEDQDLGRSFENRFSIGPSFIIKDKITVLPQISYQIRYYYNQSITNRFVVWLKFINVFNLRQKKNQKKKPKE